MGNGLKIWLCAAAPTAFYHLPEQIRVDVVRTYGQRRGTSLEVLGPSGSWWLKERVEGSVPILLGHGVREAEAKGSKVVLHVDGPDGPSRHLTVDHVIAATGYRFSVGSLPFPGQRLMSELRCVQEAPSLSPSFESSISGLYFTGIASAYNFGPVRTQQNRLLTQMASANEGLSPFPVFVLKTGHYALNHGGLGIIRSLAMLGAPVFQLLRIISRRLRSLNIGPEHSSGTPATCQDRGCSKDWKRLDNN
ncbi:hypothetical protein ACVIWV_001080 [Bradyrhizobium diazoefficiens]